MKQLLDKDRFGPWALVDGGVFGDRERADQAARGKWPQCRDSSQED